MRHKLTEKRFEYWVFTSQSRTTSPISQTNVLLSSDKATREATGTHSMFAQDSPCLFHNLIVQSFEQDTSNDPSMKDVADVTAF